MPQDFRDLRIHPELIHGSFVETIRQRVGLFNAASNNTFVMASGSALGFSEEETFFEQVDTVGRLDETSDGDIGVNKITGSQWVKPHIFRWVALQGEELNLWLQGRRWDPEALSLAMGEKFAKDTMKDRANTSIRALLGAMLGESDMVLDAADESPPGTISHRRLNRVMQKLGDQRDEIGMLVMNSTTWADLIDQSIVDDVYNVGGFTIRQGVPLSLNIPVFVIDSPALTETVSPGTDNHYILALRPGAMVLTDLLVPTFDFDTDILKHNQVMTIRGDLRYQLYPQGFSWDDGNNPNDAALDNASNWDYQMDDVKSGPGVVLKVQETT